MLPMRYSVLDNSDHDYRSHDQKFFHQLLWDGRGTVEGEGEGCGSGG